MDSENTESCDNSDNDIRKDKGIMKERYLTILEVSQKQAYIFQSNELRRNILNSAVIAWIMSEDYMKKTIHDDSLFDLDKNLVYSGGGHTVLEFETEEKAVSFTQKITTAIKKEYQGIEIFAAKQKYDESKKPGDNLKELIESLEYKKSIRKAAFHQGSFGVERINTNTLKPMLEGETLERTAKSKMPESEEKIDKELTAEGFGRVYKFEELGGSKDEANFIAVVHIDGNAMGKRVENLRKKYDECGWEEYKGILKEFSRSIDSQFKEAYKEMAEFVGRNVKNGYLNDLELKDNKLPVRRIITAGDDICFVAEGRIGLECAAAFIRALGTKINKADQEGYAACAGVAIVHQKYPFYKAYELAELLCGNAKKFGASLSEDGSGKDVSAIDWHIEFGEVKDTLKEIRKGYFNGDGRMMIQRPYIVGASEKILEAEPLRRYENFRELILELQKEESYARGSLKGLRFALKQGEKEAEYFLRFHRIEELLKDRLQDKYELLYDALELIDTFIKLEEGEN